MRNLFKKAASFALCAVIGLSAIPAVGCSSNSVEFWSTYNTVKVKQDRHDYDKTNEKLAAKINLTMAQGEYETAQIIFTPKKAVKSYTITVSDLTNVATGEVFSKDRIKVYKQEYMYLATIEHNLDGLTTAGYYPDAMIPFDAIVKFKENTVKAGDNQGISFRFSTRPELDEDGIAKVKDENATKYSERYYYVSSGTYTGSVEFNIDGTKTKIPVTLNIADATVSETNHVKSYYAVWRSSQMADLNYTQEGLDTWTALFNEYRISNRLLFNDLDVSYGVLEEFTDTLCSWLKDPRYSCFTLQSSNNTYKDNFGTDDDVKNRRTCFTKESYLKLFDESPYYAQSFYHPETAEGYKSKFVKTDEDGNKYAYQDYLSDVYAGNMVYMQSQVWYILRNSLEDGINYLEKCQYEFSQIDEPWSHNGHDAVMSCLTLFRAAVIDLAERINAEENPSLVIDGKTITLDFANSTLTKEEVTQAVLDFKTIVTADYLETYDGIIEKWCPTNDFYSSQEQRDNYSNQIEKWWYPVGDPLSLNDRTEVSPLYLMIQGWMMAEYDVSGTLYWGGALFTDVASGDVLVDEFFRSNYYRYSTVNGNGYFAYPGGQYELDEAIPSIRLEALRDGLEDFELLYNLKNTYKEVSQKIGVDFDASSVIESLCASLFANDKVSADSLAYAAARQSLLNLTSSAESAANMCIVDYGDDGYGNLNFKVYVNDGVTLYNAGKEVTSVAQVLDGGKIYNISHKLSGSVNMLDLSFTVDGKNYVYTQNLGGNVEVYEVGDFSVSDFAKSSEINFTATEVDCATEGVYTQLGGKAIKLVVGESKEKKEDDKLQYFKFESDFIKNAFSKASKVIFHIYAEEDTLFRMEYKQNGSDSLNEFITTNLTNGENTLMLTLPAVDWEEEWIEYFDFCVGEKAGATTVKTLYFKDIIVYE